MMSPFDIAAAQPILGRPSKKKWIPSLGSVSRKLSSRMISGSDMDVSNTSGSDRTIVTGCERFLANSSVEKEVVAVTFSNPCNVETIGGFHKNYLEGFGWGDVASVTSDPSLSPYGVDMVHVPPKDFPFDPSVESTDRTGKWSMSLRARYS
jgi:hypothetical protein